MNRHVIKDHSDDGAAMKSVPCSGFIILRRKGLLVVRSHHFGPRFEHFIALLDGFLDRLGAETIRYALTLLDSSTSCDAGRPALIQDIEKTQTGLRSLATRMRMRDLFCPKPGKSVTPEIVREP